MLNDTIHKYKTLKEEVEDFYEIILKVNSGSWLQCNNGSKTRFKVRHITMLKSSLMVMLYNVIEFSINSTLDIIHQIITDSKLGYRDVTPHIRSVWFKYHAKAGSEKAFIKTLNEISQHIEGEKHINLEYREYIKKVNIFSGNLDARKIKEVFNQYGIYINFDDEEKSMLKVKNNRNSLSHGDKSFTNCSRDITVEEAGKIKDCVFDYLDNVYAQVEKYLNEEEYKACQSNIS